MRIRYLSLATGLLPIVAIHIALILAIYNNAVPACIPYLDGCTSISATGRYAPASFVFKPAMTVEAVLMALYWIANFAWIKSLQREQIERFGCQRVMVPLGIGSALSLIVYVTFLGTQLPIYEFMRRIGIYFYFLLSVVAQIILAIQTIKIARARRLRKLFATGRLQLWLAIIPFLLGALNLVLKATLAEPDAAENVIEWIFALLMHLYFLLSFYAWKTTNFSIRWGTNIKL